MKMDTLKTIKRQALLEAAIGLDKLRRTMIPYFSGGLELSQIQSLNRKIDFEL
jgi:hypothetical protein